MANLTEAQKSTLKVDILANTDPVIIQARLDGANGVIAGWYSDDASPDYWVFKKRVPLNEVSAAIELDDVANMTSGDNEKLKTFYAIREVSGVFSEKATDRDGFNDIFSAAAGDDSQQALIALWRRLANRLEQLFVVGSGDGTNGNPDTLVVEGPATADNVQGWET